MHPHGKDLAKSNAGRGGFIAAAVLGAVHAAFSIYWAQGGTWLVWSLGSSLLETFEGRQWVLFPVGVVKLIAAVAPLVLAHRGRPGRRLMHAACWLGAGVLIVWGGVNAVVGNLVLAGVIRPESGYDHPGMVGHAYLWDPLFLAWGVAVALGMFHSQRRVHGQVSSPR